MYHCDAPFLSRMVGNLPFQIQSLVVTPYVFSVTYMSKYNAEYFSLLLKYIYDLENVLFLRYIRLHTSFILNQCIYSNTHCF